MGTMNETRVMTAAAHIAKRRAALKWLEEYSHRLMDNDDHAQVAVYLSLASACPGAKEAGEVLSAYAKLELPTIIKHALECCRNDIEISINAIREEIEKAA